MGQNTSSLRRQVGTPIPTAFVPWCRVWKPDLQTGRYLDFFKSHQDSGHEMEIMRQVLMRKWRGLCLVGDENLGADNGGTSGEHE